MARRIGFFPIMIASFLLTVAFTLPFQARAAEPAAVQPVPNAAVVEKVATLVEERYVIPAIGRRYAATLRANLKAGRYDEIADPAALADRITADLQAVAPDGHLRVRVPRAQVPSPTIAPGAATPPPAKEVAPGIREARWIAPGIAYIAFERFSDDPAATVALTDFLRTHRDARALVIDARDHHGGSFPMLGILGDRLFAKPRHLVDMDVAKKVVEQYGVPFPECPELRQVAAPAGLVRYEHWSVPATDGGTLFDVPVYYLTSHRTFSAAEHMAMVLKSSGRATLIGEATGGGNHFGGTEDVGGGLEMFVPIGRTTDPRTGADWEGHGVAPDVAVPADAALDTALKLIAARR